MDMTTPALLFPAISLLFVAYTNRLHSLSVLIRAMTTEGSEESKTKHTEEQLDILQKRLNYKDLILVIFEVNVECFGRDQCLE